MSSLKLDHRETECLISGLWRSCNQPFDPITSVIEIIAEFSGLYIYELMLMYTEKCNDNIYKGSIDMKRKTYIQSADPVFNIEWKQRKRPLINYCVDESRKYLYGFGWQNLKISLMDDSIETNYGDKSDIPGLHRKLMHIKIFHNDKGGVYAMGGYGDGSEWEDWYDFCYKFVDLKWEKMAKLLVGKAKMNVVDIDSKYMFEAGAQMGFRKYESTRASMYNYDTNKWKRIADSNNSRPGNCGIAYSQIQNKVFICGKTRDDYLQYIHNYDSDRDFDESIIDNIFGAEFYDFHKNKWYSDKCITNDFDKCYHLEFTTNGNVLIGLIDNQISVYDTRTNDGWSLIGEFDNHADGYRFSGPRLCAFL